MRKFKTIASVFVSCILLTAAAVSQAPERSGIRIALIDQIGNIIVDAEVRLVSADGCEKKAFTNNDGVVEFRGLRPGQYRFTAQTGGFKPYRSELIELKAAEFRRLDVAMQLADIETTIDVNKDDEATLEGTGVTRQLTEEQLEQLPDDPDELRRILQRIAGQDPTGEQMGITVNGVPGGQLPPKQDIKLIRVNRNVFSAQYEGTSGGGIEIFTNSAVKKPSGWISYNVSDSIWGAADPFVAERVPYHIDSVYGGFRMPLGKKASLSISGSSFRNKTSSVVNATVLDGSFRPVSLRDSFATPTRSERMAISIDADPNKRHKLFFSYTFFNFRAENSGVGGFNLVERGNHFTRPDHSFAFTETFIPNPEVVNTTRVSAQYSSTRTLGSITTPALNVQDAFFGGGSQTDSLAKNGRIEFYNDTTKKVGRWNIGFGVMFRALTLSDESRSNFGGTYTFTGGIAPVLDDNHEPVFDEDGNIVTAQITSLESYRRTLLFRSLGYSAEQIRELGGGADQFSIAGGRPYISVRQFDLAAYGQANYSLTDTIGLSFGVRYENQTNIGDAFNLAPRFGIAWVPKTKDKQKPITTLPRITVGLGLFYSRFPLSNTLNVRQASETERAYYFITDPDILDLFPAVPDIATLEQFQTPRSLRHISGDLQTPVQAIFNASATKKIWLGLSITGSYTHVEALRQTVTRNVNAPLAGTFPNAPVYPFGINRNIQEYQSRARNRIDRINVSAQFPEWKMWKGTMYLGVNYSFQWSRGNVVSGSGTPFDPYDFSQEWGPNIRDGFHAIYGWMSIPLPKKFYFNTNWEFDSGVRFNIYTGRDTNGDGFYLERPSFASDPSKPGVVTTPYGLLDPNPGPNDLLVPRNLGRGPITSEFDAGLSRSFGFNKDKNDKAHKPRQYLSFRINANNVFNFNNKAAPVGNMTSPYFLQSISGQTYGGGPGNSEQRRLTFGTSFSF
jgi:hypothetical protein